MATDKAEQAKHAQISPSGAERIFLCPASLLLSQGLPNESSEAAIEGTRAHRLAELTVRERYHLSGFTPLTAAEQDEWRAAFSNAPQEMIDAVEVYAAKIGEVLQGRKAEYAQTEVRLPIGNITGEDGAFGTADCVMVLGSELHVLDFKYGAGTFVSPYNNVQLQIYGLAAATELDPEGLIFGINVAYGWIIQPRMNNVDKAKMPLPKSNVGEDGFHCEEMIAYWRRRFDRARCLLEHPDELTPMESARGGDFLSVSLRTDLCKYCRGKLRCPMQREAVVRAVTLSKDGAALEAEQAKTLKIFDQALPVPSTNEALAQAWTFLDAIDGWCAAVRKECTKRLNEGEELPGLKLVAGRQGVRKWKDPKEVELQLRKCLKVEDVYDRKVISPTSAEKLAKKGLIGPRVWKQLQLGIARAAGTPSVALASDPRPAVTPQIENDFEVVDG